MNGKRSSPGKRHGLDQVGAALSPPSDACRKSLGAHEPGPRAKYFGLETKRKCMSTGYWEGLPANGPAACSLGYLEVHPEDWVADEEVVAVHVGNPARSADRLEGGRERLGSGREWGQPALRRRSGLFGFRMGVFGSECVASSPDWRRRARGEPCLAR